MLDDTLFDHVDDDSEEIDPVFDLEEGKRLKKAGMDHAARSGLFRLLLARRVAKHVAMQRPSRTVTSDDIYRYCRDRYKLGTKWLGKRSGSVWTDGQWKKLEVRSPSQRTKQHAAELGTWQLIKDDEKNLEPFPAELVHQYIPEDRDVSLSELMAHLKPGVSEAVVTTLELSRIISRYDLTEQDLLSGFKLAIRSGHDTAREQLSRVIAALGEAKGEQEKK